MRAMSKLFAATALTGAVLVGGVQPATATTLLADVVIDFFDSGAGPLPGPFGGTLSPSSFPVPVPLTHATDGDENTFVSLPLGSFIVLGFSGGFVFDGPGNDIFIFEVGGADELADVFISDDFGASFTFLGTATTDTLSGFDLADIGFAGQVNAVKVVGLDNFGGSPGFDIAFARGLEGSVVIDPETPVIPAPAAAPLLLSALGGLAFLRRRRRRA